MKKMKTITPPFMQMKTFKAFFFALTLLFITGQSMAQQVNASLSDYVATWSGIGNDGNTYTMTLNSDNSAILKAGVSITDVVSWKLKFNDLGDIDYDKNDHAVMRLISNVIATNTGSVANQTTLNPKNVSASLFKIYLADVYYETATNTITMNADFGVPAAGSSGPTAVTITFTK